jgi:predicted transcriptional regulator
MESPSPATVISLLSSPIGVVLKPDIIILESNSSVEEAARLMKEKNSRSVFASHRGEVVGIVSKTDILFKVLSQNRNPSKVRLREIMTCPVLAISPNTTVREALSVMDKHNVRQVMVHAYAAALGLVTRDDIYQMIEKLSTISEDTVMSGTPVCLIDPKTVAYVRDESKVNFKCPYCGSPFDTKEALSKHIDRLHEETGVLEGDMRHMFE